MIPRSFYASSLLRIALAAAVAAALAGIAAGALAATPKAPVGSFNDDSVSVFDTAAGSVLATESVAAGPRGWGREFLGARIDAAPRRGA